MIKKKQIMALLLAFCTLLVCILLHCWLRDWCGNLQIDSGHMV